MPISWWTAAIMYYVGEGPILPAALARHSSSSCIQSSGVLPKLKFQPSYIFVFTSSPPTNEPKNRQGRCLLKYKKSDWLIEGNIREKCVHDTYCMRHFTFIRHCNVRVLVDIRFRRLVRMLWRPFFLLVFVPDCCCNVRKIWCPLLSKLYLLQTPINIGGVAFFFLSAILMSVACVLCFTRVGSRINIFRPSSSL